MQEEKKDDTSAAGAVKAAATATPKEQERQTQSIIRSLYDASTSEFMTPSVGDPYSVERDPHLRLRRTLAPSLNLGIPKYAEAQFMLSKKETTGKRIKLEFGVNFDGKRKEFTMDTYAFGASEAEADVRIVTLHGISPGVSRTRWHKLGARYDAMQAEASSSKLKKKVRFVALDWHSIDRSVDDDTNDEYLTCLPKHLMEVPSNEEDTEEMIRLFDSEERREWMRKLAGALLAGMCPRGFDDGGRIFRAVIEEGLGWGTEERPFVLGLKSWSGGMGLRMLAQLARDRKAGSNDTTTFADNIQGAVIMHPGCFDKNDIIDAMSSNIIPAALMCWAKDDPLVPYAASGLYLDAATASGGDDGRVKLVTYERGGHHNFDGSGGLPNFDDEVIEWIESLP